jgi:hypothetical protein
MPNPLVILEERDRGKTWKPVDSNAPARVVIRLLPSTAEPIESHPDWIVCSGWQEREPGPRYTAVWLLKRIAPQVVKDAAVRVRKNRQRHETAYRSR